MPPITGLTPLLQVFDMPTSVRFYRDVLGFTIAMTDRNAVGDDFDWGLLKLGDVSLMLNTRYEKPDRPAAPDPARVIAHDDTGLYFHCAALDALHAHLVSHGVSAAPPKTAPYGMRQLYLHDPDGYALCFQHPV